MPGPVSATETLTSPLTCAAADVDGAAGGRELHGVREQVEDHLPDPALVARDDVDLRVRRERDPYAVLRRALAHHRRRRARALLQRERRDLELDLPCLDLRQVEHVVDEREQVVPRGEDVVEVLRLLLVDLAGHPLAQHLREADDRVQRRPQLVRHVGQEVRLVLARRLELPVEAPELVVHPVHVAASAPSSSRLVTSTCPEKSPGRDRGKPGVDPLDRPDQRPREDEPEQQREDDRSRRHADEQIARARVRARVLGDQGVGPRRRGVCELGGVLVEVDARAARPSCEGTALV